MGFFISCGGLLISTKRFSVREILYPSFCLSCRLLISFNQVLCAACRLHIASIPVVYEKEGDLAFTLHAVGRYEGLLGGLVRAKERKERQGTRNLGVLMAQYAVENRLNPEVIIAVPLHWKRQLIRGYNQAAILAYEIQKKCAGSICAHPFRRKKATQIQRLLAKEERLANVVDAFGCSLFWREKKVRALVRGKRVMVVDDVYTTGATVRSFIQLISQYKPASITVFVACRA